MLSFFGRFGCSKTVALERTSLKEKVYMSQVAIEKHDLLMRNLFFFLSSTVYHHSRRCRTSQRKAVSFDTVAKSSQDKEQEGEEENNKNDSSSEGIQNGAGRGGRGTREGRREARSGAGRSVLD